MALYLRIFNKICRIINNASPSKQIDFIHIRRARRKHLEKLQCEAFERLVVFFVPGVDRINGGIMSIISIATETRKLYAESNTGVFVCTLPSDPPLANYTKFDNNFTLLDFNKLISKCSNTKTILFHIPEGYVELITRKYKRFFNFYRANLKFNIMLQNIDMAPDVCVVDSLKKYGRLTITTAHKSYSGEETERKYRCPVHHLSAWVNSNEYLCKSLSEKKKLIIVSPDEHPLRIKILNKIKSELVDFEFITIQNMTYAKYLQTISESRFSLTFGEGLDGYFSEQILSGGIGCTVYNDRFFDQEYKGLPFIYDTWEKLAENFANDVCNVYSDEEKFNQINESQRKVLSVNYSFIDYQNNIKEFYKRYF